MLTAADELDSDPLHPGIDEVVVGAASAVHAILVALVLVQALRRKITVPHGLLAYIALFLLPVAGPLLVLADSRRSRTSAMTNA